jgi:hypothetical protein
MTRVPTWSALSQRSCLSVPPLPENDLERALRRELSAAVSRVEPGTEALERIRTRTKQREPQPWLVAVASGAFHRARHWVWRGHWAWPDRLPRLRRPP